ncbi:MAG TPA: 16S rRNA (cytosine(1402)-N(4))-methyltransferase RsmH [Fimbriimonadaceae bacterium]|nr:16S rRNA (cytosine(1402)-N(4))-methyltransferase RsmH [Fimbriimonadaceae bacterium]HRJ33058.1 16S rRNA (cytosine(1402)-N(4))-methyltransferase RsmH [Fimbriimonadaceae bacterium]
MEHIPVFLEEVLQLLPLKPGAVIVDGTLGLAGHSLEITRRISPGGTLIGFDWDESMLQEARRRLESVKDCNIHFVHSDYRQIPAALQELVPNRLADGILLDLGLNNAQILDPTRGITFRQEGPLDMRMDRSQGEPASALLNRISPPEIEKILRDYGDERWAKRIAEVIVTTRKENPLRTTEDLVQCVLKAIPTGARDKRIHPATRTFQAVRIAVNHELEGLRESVLKMAQKLQNQGVLIALAYHSGEDRQIKQAFQELQSEECFEVLFKKPLQPSEEEISKNPKARSAKLRAIRRL